MSNDVLCVMNVAEVNNYLRWGVAFLFKKLSNIHRKFCLYEMQYAKYPVGKFKMFHISLRVWGQVPFYSMASLHGSWRDSKVNGDADNLKFKWQSGTNKFNLDNKIAKFFSIPCHAPTK